MGSPSSRTPTAHPHFWPQQHRAVPKDNRFSPSSSTLTLPAKSGPWANIWNLVPAEGSRRWSEQPRGEVWKVLLETPTSWAALAPTDPLAMDPAFQKCCSAALFAGTRRCAGSLPARVLQQGSAREGLKEGGGSGFPQGPASGSFFTGPARALLSTRPPGWASISRVRAGSQGEE